jgi:hypothetical protein
LPQITHATAEKDSSKAKSWECSLPEELHDQGGGEKLFFSWQKVILRTSNGTIHFALCHLFLKYCSLRLTMTGQTKAVSLIIPRKKIAEPPALIAVQRRNAKSGSARSESPFAIGRFQETAFPAQRYLSRLALLAPRACTELPSSPDRIFTTFLPMDGVNGGIPIMSGPCATATANFLRAPGRLNPVSKIPRIFSISFGSI